MQEKFSTKESTSKTILHIDGDAFFVGVEVAKNPKLKGLPVVTGGERGIVSALSYEAKALGVVRGMPIFRVKKKFPQVIIMNGDYASYVHYSGMMFDIVRRYADDVEEYSIDECFADLTGLEPPLKMSYRQMAERIKREITDELRLSVSIGIAPTKVLAKVASKWQKPNGLTIIEYDKIADFLEKTPIEKIWGIGPSASMFLKRFGIMTAHEHLSKPHEIIWRELNGESVMELDPHQKTVYSSVQKTRTFYPATGEPAFLLSQFSKHIEDACAKARHYNLAPKKISFFLKTKDFQYQSFSVSLQTPTNSPEVLMNIVTEHFKEVHTKGILYRTAGVSLIELIPEDIGQKDLFGFGGKSDKLGIIHKHIDALENKLGKRLVHLGSTHRAIKRPLRRGFADQEEKGLGTDSDDLDRNLLFL